MDGCSSAQQHPTGLSPKHPLTRLTTSDTARMDRVAEPARTVDGYVSERKQAQVAIRIVPAIDGRPRHRLFDEPLRQRLGQCRDGELLLVAQNRTNSVQDLSNTRQANADVFDYIERFYNRASPPAACVPSPRWRCGGCGLSWYRHAPGTGRSNRCRADSAATARRVRCRWFAPCGCRPC
jgi:hypothetical protein